MGMAQTVGDSANVYPFGNHNRGVAVTEGVERYPRKVTPLQELREPAGDGIRVDGPSVPLGEQPVGFLPAVPCFLLLLVLVLLILPEHLTDAGANGHFTDTGLCLRLFGDIVPGSKILGRTADGKRLVFKVYII